MLKREDLDRIHGQTIKVLEETGVSFHCEEALSIFKKAGARVNGNVVYITGKMVEQAVADAPSHFTWHAADSDNNLVVGGSQERVHVMLSHGTVYIQDMDSGKRKAVLTDLANIYKLGQASRVCNVLGQVPVEPSDIEAENRYLYITRELLRHSSKPLVSHPVENQAQVKDVFSMVEIVMGSGYLDEHPAVGVSICALSPLKYSPDSCETLIAYARKRQPLLVLTCAMSGITAPIHTIGAVILQNAETLSGLVLAQLISPGTPFVYCPASAVPNMRSGSYITSSPESNLINIAGLQMAREMYHLPTRTMAGLTDSKTVDCQAGFETMQNFTTMMLAGANLINECVGVLDSIMTVSYEKFIIDEEMISRVLRIVKGVDVSENAFDISAIQEIGQNGNYLMHPSTFSQCRNLWSPEVSDTSSYEVWEQNGSLDIVTRANQKFKERLAACPDILVDKKTDAALTRFIQSKI